MIDTHAHIYAEEFDDDRAEVFERAHEVGVEGFLLPAIDSQTNEALFATAREHKNCYPLIGLHPTSVNDNPRWRDELAEVGRLLRLWHEGSAASPVERVYGVGEIGLDFYWSEEFKAEQQEAFRTQVEWAIEYDLPMVIHTRNAWGEMLDILEHYKGRARGVLHAFGEGVEVYERIRHLGGFAVGIGGVCTYKKSPLLESIPQMALEDMVLETDSPYLSPTPFRGKRNEPKNLVYICGQIAALKGVTPEQVAAQTTLNAKRIFDLP